MTAQLITARELFDLWAHDWENIIHKDLVYAEDRNRWELIADHVNRCIIRWATIRREPL